MKIEDSRGLKAEWVDSPTTVDLIRESNRLSVEPRGLPSGMQVYEAARVLHDMNLPLRPLQPGEKWANGDTDENVCTADGEIFCAFVRRSNSCSYLDFTQHARNLMEQHVAREQTAGLETLSAPKTA